MEGLVQPAFLAISFAVVVTVAMLTVAVAKIRICSSLDPSLFIISELLSSYRGRQRWGLKKQ